MEHTGISIQRPARIWKRRAVPAKLREAARILGVKENMRPWGTVQGGKKLKLRLEM
jgi:ribosomal 50S subunit-recycling heat shock protein